jgi:hypothetical protein
MKTIHIVIQAKIGSGVFSVPIEQCNYLSETDDKYNLETAEFKEYNGLMQQLAVAFNKPVLFKDTYYNTEQDDYVIIYYNPKDLTTFQEYIVFGGNELGFKTTSEQIEIIKKAISSQ